MVISIAIVPPTVNYGLSIVLGIDVRGQGSGPPVIDRRLNWGDVTKAALG